MTKLIPVAGYLRMSSDAQDKSIDDQRAELLAYAAKRGYTVVAWFLDEGVSGWKSKERRGFQDLIADAPSGKFKGVICWDQSRFSRFDPCEANYYWFCLKREGVFIETAKEGRLDLDTLGGWLTASVQQHGKAEYCRSLAADVVRGKRKRALEGRWQFAPAYGYKIVDGKLALGDAGEVETVRRIFQMRARGIGGRTICLILNREGVPPRRSSIWSPRQIKSMLTRQTYIGNTVVGEVPSGKFSRMFDSMKVFENTHPAIIDSDLWDRVQAVNSRKRTRHSAKASVGGHLSGLLVCGCCGRNMFSDGSRRRYVCGTYHTGAGCTFNVIDFDAALGAIAAKIRSVLLMGSIDALTEAVERVLAKRKLSANRTDSDTLKRQVADIDRKLEAAAGRLLEVEPQLVKDVRAAMLALKDKRAALIERIEAETTQSRRKPLTARQIAEKAWELDKLLRNGEPATVREALSGLIDRIEIDYVVTSRGKVRTKARPSGGTVVFSSTGATLSGVHS